MANQKISELTNTVTAPADGDQMVIENASEHKNVTIANLKTKFIEDVVLGKSAGAALGAAVDWADGTFQPKTGSGAEAITSITNPELGVNYLTITGGTSCSVSVTGLTFLKKNVFNPNESVNVLKITCIDSVTPVYHAEWLTTDIEIIEFALGAEEGELTVGELFLSRTRFAFDLVDVRASVKTAPTDADVILDIHKNGTTVMTTNKLEIDATEKTSVTATTPPAITTVDFADDDEFSIECDQIGSTLPGAGCKVVMYIRRT